MFLVDMTFIDMDSVTPELTEKHRNYLAGEYLTGALLFGGRKDPRTGGILISQHADEAQLQQIMEQDPFVQSGVVSYKITAFTPVMASPEYQGLLSKHS